jgi:hypothetical protein
VRHTKGFAQHTGKKLNNKKCPVMEIPQRYKRMIGKKFTFSGNLFNQKESLKRFRATVIDVRFGTAQIFDLKTHEYTHPTIEFLLKNNSMKRSQWCRPMPCPEIQLDPKTGYPKV